ncbi:MAG: hypothetical protein IJS61_00445 [Firmicutes bacterium]|nr:hypothetical protein [Bacillota bacterium]
MLDLSKNPQAYTEVLEVLKHTRKEDYDKIPKEILKVFEENRDKTYDFHIDVEKELEEQNLLKETYAIIGFLYRDYWATPEERIIYDEKLKRNEKKAKLKEYSKGHL